MCGISGACSFEGVGIDRAIIKKMTNSLKHRGPDDEGYYFEENGNLGLGHSRLSIIDVAGGHQPIFNEDSSLVIVFNGEIYNFLELRDGLRKRGHKFATNTDTEVIIHLYEEIGVDCLKKLRGMFAFAIWDKKKGELFLARDRMGKKPLYYTLLNNKIYFASEIQALYEIPGIKKDIDYSAIDLYLTYSYIPSPYSIYKSIKKLPPANFLQFTKSSTSVCRYWKPDYNKKLNINYEDAKSELLRILKESIQLRLISDVPLGAFLSGGIDSSAIVALMSGLSNQPVKTFSIGFSNKEYNELPYARMISKQYKTEHHEFLVEPNALEIIPSIVKLYAEPYGDSSALPTWYLSQVTKEHVTVALNGDGGDELFGGYPWYPVIHKFNRVANFASTWLSHNIHKTCGNILPRKVRKIFELLSKKEVERFQMLRSFVTTKDRDELYHNELKEQLDKEAEEYIYQLYDSSLKYEYDRSFYADIMSYLPEDLLVKVDRASMSHSLECRSPLLDHELVEFSCSLLPEWKIKKNISKFILKETVGPLFPEGFTDRRKMGFSVPIREWFRSELKPYVTDKLLDGPLTRIPLLRHDQLEKILALHFCGKRNFETLIWNLLMLSLWFEEFE